MSGKVWRAEVLDAVCMLQPSTCTPQIQAANQQVSRISVRALLQEGRGNESKGHSPVTQGLRQIPL